MKAMFAVGVVLWSATAVCRGGSTEEVVLAAMKVSEVPSYSWRSIVSDDAQTYEVEGKTERGGCTWLRMPMVPELARRLGRDADWRVEALFKPGNPCVIRTLDGWKFLDELPRCHDDWIDEPPVSGHAVMMGGLPFLLGSRAPLPARATLRADGESIVYGNAQFGLSHPHEELAVIVCSATAMEGEDGAVRGTLTDLGAQLLLVRDGQKHLEPLRAAGSYTLWIDDGIVVRYALELEGVLKIKRKKVVVRQSTKTNLTAFGRTQVKLPREAEMKLDW